MDRILAIGVYCTDIANSAPGIAAELGSARNWAVDQRWAALGQADPPNGMEEWTAQWVRQPIATVLPRRLSRLLGSPAPGGTTAKFHLVNTLLDDTDLSQYAYVIVCDDDIDLPRGFLDAFMDRVAALDLALAQPALTADSNVGINFVRQIEGLAARITRFVEVGPLVVFRQDVVPLLFPFDTTSPMGLGYDLVWPVQIEKANKRMGIVDETPVTHKLRPVNASYRFSRHEPAMRALLKGKEHLPLHKALQVLTAFPAGSVVSPPHDQTVRARRTASM